MVETLAVGSIVLVACLHVLWQLAPTLWRQPFAARLAVRLEALQRTEDAANHAQHAAAGHVGNRLGGMRWRELLLRMLRAPSAGCGDCGGRSRCPAQQPNPNRQDIDRSRLIIVSRG